MRIIDLVEKQRHNEILPKHIKYENENLYFDGVTYFDKEGNNDLLDILAMNSSALTHLYDEVEIIEEDKDIEKITIFEHNNSIQFKNGAWTGRNLDKAFAYKINEIIDDVNKLKKL